MQLLLSAHKHTMLNDGVNSCTIYFCVSSPLMASQLIEGQHKEYRYATLHCFVLWISPAEIFPGLVICSYLDFSNIKYEDSKKMCLNKWTSVCLPIFKQFYKNVFSPADLPSWWGYLCIYQSQYYSLLCFCLPRRILRNWAAHTWDAFWKLTKEEKRRSLNQTRFIIIDNFEITTFYGLITYK